MKRSLLIAPALALALVLPFAAVGMNGQNPLAAAMTYPVLGLAHILAAVGMGVWAGRLGEHAPVLLPVAFVLGAAMGIVLAIEEIRLLVFAEPMIWVSALALNVAAAYAVRVPFGDAVGVVALFGFYHGYALGGALGSAEARGTHGAHPTARLPCSAGAHDAHAQGAAEPRLAGALPGRARR